MPAKFVEREFSGSAVNVIKNTKLKPNICGKIFKKIIRNIVLKDHQTFQHDAVNTNLVTNKIHLAKLKL